MHNRSWEKINYDRNTKRQTNPYGNLISFLGNRKVKVIKICKLKMLIK